MYISLFPLPWLLVVPSDDSNFWQCCITFKFFSPSFPPSCAVDFMPQCALQENKLCCHRNFQRQFEAKKFEFRNSSILALFCIVAIPYKNFSIISTFLQGLLCKKLSESFVFTTLFQDFEVYCLCVVFSSSATLKQFLKYLDIFTTYIFTKYLLPIIP